MEIPDKVEKAKLTFDGAVINVTINGAWQYLRAERQMALATCGLGAPRTREIAPSVNYYGDVNTVVVCDAERRQQLIEQRQRLLEQEATQASGRKVEAAVPVTLAVQEPQYDASAGAGNGVVAQEQDPVSRHMESIRNAETWKPSEPKNGAMFGPHPEEIY